MLRDEGCAWSEKRQQWYFEGESLPQVILGRVRPTKRQTAVIAPAVMPKALEEMIINALGRDDAREAADRAAAGAAPQTYLAEGQEPEAWSIKEFAGETRTEGDDALAAALAQAVSALGSPQSEEEVEAVLRHMEALL